MTEVKSKKEEKKARNIFDLLPKDVNASKRQPPATETWNQLQLDMQLKGFWRGIMWGSILGFVLGVLLI